MRRTPALLRRPDKRARCRWRYDTRSEENMADILDNPYRRSFLKAGAGAVGTMALGADRPGRPNLIFMTTDGHRPDALSLNGNRILQTPNFDRIGREGIQFRNS